MPICISCSEEFPNNVIINGKERSLCKRKHCLNCLPFGHKNNIDLTIGEHDRKWLNHRHAYQYSLRKKRKEHLVNLLGGSCNICKYDRCLSALSFHHISSEEKLFNLCETSLSRYSWESALKEVVKTICVCNNCHSEIHAGMHKKDIDEWLIWMNENKRSVIEKGLSLYPQRKKENYHKRCKYCGSKYQTNKKESVFCSTKCCGLANRKVDRPSEEHLKRLLVNKSFCAVGKMYGVSDNAIRKWLKT